MIEMILTGVGMLAITLLFQFVAHRKNKWKNFWVGTSVIFVICVVGIVSKDPAYFAAILGYVIGDEIGELAGWHAS